MSDWLPDLTDDDLTTLVEALEAWESKDAANEMFGDVMDIITTDKASPETRDQIRTERERDKAKRQREKVVRKERSVMLRAKLLTLRDRRRVDAVVKQQ